MHRMIIRLYETRNKTKNGHDTHEGKLGHGTHWEENQHKTVHNPDRDGLHPSGGAALLSKILC